MGRRRKEGGSAPCCVSESVSVLFLSLVVNLLDHLSSYTRDFRSVYPLDAR